MTSKTLSYKGFVGSAEIDMDDNVCVGKLLFIDDLVMYEADAPAGLQAAFERAVNDYMAACAATGKSPQRTCSGTFNVRISPEKHRAAALCAADDGVTLNEVVVRAIDCYLDIRVGVSHYAMVTAAHDGPLQTIQATASANPSWNFTHVTH